MNDWQEAYYDLVNKVECECVQQGDLVPIWEQFKRMSLTIQKLQGHQGALEAEIEQMREALTQIARLRTDLRGDFSRGAARVGRIFLPNSCFVLI